MHSPSFRATPLDVKAEADIHFLQGINQLIGHGWPYSAPGVEFPGWRFYAAGVFNEKNPWWIVMPDLAKYLQRVSFMMRQGQPANDVALYLPNDDGWADLKIGNPHLIETLREQVGSELMPAIFEAGYNLDFFDDDSFKEIGRVDNGSLVLGRNRYKVVILPAVESIPLETYRKFEQFARAGGILIATRRTPSDAPGLVATQKEREEVGEISKRLFMSQSSNGHFVLNERAELGPALKKLVRPDVDFGQSSTDIGFVHRKTNDTDIYFIANTSNSTRKVSANFRVAELRAELWNPFDGTVRSLNAERSEGRTQIALKIEPYGSRIIVFSKRTLPVKASTSAKLPASLDISKGWTVSIGSGKPASFDTLRSWTEDESTRYYSGVASYTREFQIEPAMLSADANIALNFGNGTPLTPRELRNGMQAWLDSPVREAAVVYLNNKRAGSVWCPPYSIEVRRFLKPGINTIRIEVANTAMNYMAGHSLPDFRLLNLRFGERFQQQDMDKIEALPSGLLGPIRLVPE